MNLVQSWYLSLALAQNVSLWWNYVSYFPKNYPHRCCVLVNKLFKVSTPEGPPVSFPPSRARPKRPVCRRIPMPCPICRVGPVRVYTVDCRQSRWLCFFIHVIYTADIVNLAKLFIPNAKSFAIFCANSKADSCPYTYMSRSQKLLQSKMYASRVRAWDVREGVKESFFSYSPLKIIPNTSYLKPLMI